jgi:hypothetical protein
LIKFFKDLYNFILLKKNIQTFDVGFFSESNFIYEYLEPYILKKIKNRKVLILSFEDIEKSYLKSENIFVFKTKLFQQITFLTLNIKYLYSSTPNLNHTIFQRSKVSKCKYIYLSHSPVSMNLIYSLNAFDHFDAVQVISKYQHKEMKEIIKKRKLKIKVFRSKYLFIDKQIKKIENNKFRQDVLIAPTWNTNFYKTNCHLELSKILKENKINFKLRPHPMSIKNNEISLLDLKKEKIEVDNFKYLSFEKYDYLISDWSGIFIEYALIFKRKAYLINTSKKIINKDYLTYENIPIEISLRNILANSFNINEIKPMVKEILFQKKIKNKTIDSDIKKIINDNFY